MYRKPLSWTVLALSLLAALGSVVLAGVPRTILLEHFGDCC